MAVRYGRYEVLYKLGQGAMAQVFLAKDPVLSRFVAIKVLHADLATRKDVLQRFFNEARTVAAIRSPHVVEVFDFGQEGRDLYLVMEFVDGMSLHGLLRHAAPRRPDALPTVRKAGGGEDPIPSEPGGISYEPLPAAVAASLICQAADGLTIAAAHGVVHRDLKPENLILNTRGYLKISDFGIAHVQDDSLTKTGAVLGSPLYMSPEQAQGLKPITAQSDMFSLGAVFYASLAGYPPFRGRTVNELFRHIAADPHPPLARLRPDLDPGLGRLVDTLLRKRPEERGGGPEWLHRQLQAYLISAGTMDPAAAVAGYLRELGARGAQTTWKVDGRNATLPMTLASTQAETDSLSIALQLMPGRAAPAYPTAAIPLASLPTRARPGPRSRPRRVARKRAPMAMVGLVVAILGLGTGLGAWGWAALRTALDRGKASPTVSAKASAQASDRNAVSPKASPTDGDGNDESDEKGHGPQGGDSGNLAVTVPDPRRGNGSGHGDEDGAERGDGIATGNGIGDAAREGRRETQSEAGPGSDSEVAAMGGPTGRIADGSSPERVAKIREAILILKSSPPFSEAYLDGQFVGTTPVRIAPLVPGRHRLAMKSARLPGVDTSILVEPGIHALKVHLEAGAGLRVAATSVDGE
jgi:hypothetical protein